LIYHLYINNCKHRNSFVNFSHDSLLADIRKTHERIAKELRMFILRSFVNYAPGWSLAGYWNMRCSAVSSAPLQWRYNTMGLPIM